MAALEKAITWLSDLVWGPPMLVLLVGTGIFLTIRLRLLQFWQLPYALKLAFSRRQDHSSQGDVTHYEALTTALAATIGTGNIAGVATAVATGGPGAVFWMWLTAIVGMATKYAEAVLAIKYRVQNDRGEMSGGPMYYIERGLGWRWLAVLFAVFGAIACFGIGTSVQSNSVADALQRALSVPTWVTGVVLAVFTALVIIGGIKAIGRVTAFFVPIMAIVYLIGGLIVILLHLDKLPAALALIFTDAFTGEAVAGGALGTVIRYGVARGVFSNEAGLGSAPIAAAAAKTDHPCRQGLVSMTGTFLDTIVVCSVTGLVLVMSGLYADGNLSGASLTSASFNALLPGFGKWVVTIGLILFAYSTVLGWSYYGEKCFEYLFGTRRILWYRWAVVVAVFVGTVVKLDLVWSIADVFNGLMAVPNLIALLVLSGVVVAETRAFREQLQKERLSSKPGAGVTG